MSAHQPLHKLQKEEETQASEVPEEQPNEVPRLLAELAEVNGLLHQEVSALMDDLAPITLTIAKTAESACEQEAAQSALGRVLQNRVEEVNDAIDQLRVTRNHLAL